MAKFNISMDDWVVNEIVGSSALKNRSARIQELVIKGQMYEESKNRNPIKALYGLFAPNLSEVSL